MVAAETMEGINGNKAYAFPHKAVMEVSKKKYQGKIDDLSLSPYTTSQHANRKRFTE